MHAKLVDIAVDLVLPKRGQPRRHFDTSDLVLLAASLDTDGQAVPALVRAHPKKPGCFELIAGERRWRAIRDHCKNVKTLRCVVVEDAGDEHAYRLSFVENEQRVDLSPIERAGAMQKLLDDGHSQSDIARMVGKSPSYVHDYLSLTKLHPAALSLMDPARPEKKRLGFSHALAIVAAPRDQHVMLAQFAIERGTRLIDVKRKSEDARTGGGVRKRGMQPGHARQSIFDHASALATAIRRRLEPAGEIDRVFSVASSDEIQATIGQLSNLSEQIAWTATQLKRILAAGKKRGARK